MLRFLYSLIALALVLSPLGMVQGGMAMAHGASAQMSEANGHCPDSEAPAGEEDRSKAMADCKGICSALAGGEEGWPDRQLLVSLALDSPRVAIIEGLHPESDTPPPRFS
jgi:hypothetical protein